VIVIATLELNGCKYDRNGPAYRTMQQGVWNTNEFLNEATRQAEYCSLLDLAEFVPDPNQSIANLASFRASKCSPPPPSTWTDADTSEVLMRTQRMAEMDQLHTKFEAAWNARAFDTPPGDNVVEYTLAGRDRGYGKIKDYYVGVLPTLMPGLVASADRELLAANRAEFDRIFALLLRADPKWPDVARLRAAATLRFGVQY